MFSHIRHWQQSGLSIKEFCIQHQLANATFHYWLKKFRTKDQQGLPAFVPVHIQPSHSGEFAAITFPDGRKISLYQVVDAAFLKSLL